MKFLKKNFKVILGIIIGILTACNTAVLAYNFASDEVKHTKSDNSETTVELALNELYQMYDADTIILSKIYPVGSYFISDNNTNPGTIFGGTWTRIQDKVLVAAGSTYSAGSTGGNGTLTYTPAGTNSGGAVGNTTLTIDQIPSHTHATQGTDAGHSFSINNVTIGSSVLNFQYGSSIAYGTNLGSLVTGSAGGGQAHKHPFTQPTFTGTQTTLQTMNSLPRETVYVWKRTA